MKARYKVGDLITIPSWVEQQAGFYGEMESALVIEVREWEDEHSFNVPPITWDYLVLTVGGKEIRFDEGDFLCCSSRRLVAA